MSALIGDVLSGAVTPVVCNAAVNAGGKLLKVVEMQHRYGTSNSVGDVTLRLCSGRTGEEQLNRIEREIQALRARSPKS